MAMNVGHLLSVSAVRFSDKIALIQGNRKVSYRDYNNRVNSLANRLLQLDVRKGDKASLYLHNSIEWTEIYFALSKIGAVVVPINFRLKGKELIHIVRNSESKILFFDLDLQNNVEVVKHEITGITTFIALGESRSSPYASYQQLFDESSNKEPDVFVSEEDIHSICYTSGTTGLPKGAVLTNINIIMGHYLINSVEFNIRGDDITLATTPFSQRIGWAKIVTSASLGSTLVIMPSFDAEEVMKITEKERVTNISIVPTIGRLILQLPNIESYDTSSVRQFFISGESFPVALKKQLMERFPHVDLTSCFASTESGQVTIMTTEDVLKKPDSVGIPLPCVEVKIVDESGKEVDTGEVGEIAVRSGRPGMYCIMKEYYKDPEYTKKGFLGDWLRMGDVGRMDDEGYLYVLDRKKDMIISGGFNIYSREVEAVLESNKKVSEAAVIGVPDEKFGESVMAFVVLQKGSKATGDELIEYCKTKLASYKKPKYIEFVDSLPRNIAGKVLKYRLKQDRDERILRRQR
jgi:long-chain acyl-CoA synthetase